MAKSNFIQCKELVRFNSLFGSFFVIILDESENNSRVLGFEGDVVDGPEFLEGFAQVSLICLKIREALHPCSSSKYRFSLKAWLLTDSLCRPYSYIL